MKKQPDFQGWATVYGTLCGDGRTIENGAFSHQDGVTVPLVYQHLQKDPEMIIGKCLLHSAEDGVWCEGFLNNGPKAEACKEAARHGDITSLSIWANELEEKGGHVAHGMIREVSMVLAGANPKARIDYTSLHHSGLSSEEMYTDAVIYSGITFDNDEDELQHGEEPEEEVVEDEEIPEDTEGEDQEVDPEVQAFIDSEPEVNDLIEAYANLDDEDMILMNEVMAAVSNQTIDEELADRLSEMLEQQDNLTKVKLLALCALAAPDSQENTDEGE